MEVIKFSLNDEIVPLPKNGVLLLGTFDGVHEGHRHLVRLAQEKGEGPIAVLLFDRPLEPLLKRGREDKGILTSLDDKLRIFSSLGVDFAYVMETDCRLLSLRKDEFITKILIPLAPSLVIVGSDYRFGVMGKGMPIDLKVVFKTLIADFLKGADGEKVATRKIVEHIENGDVRKAALELGRPFEIVGKVAHGLENGRKIGFPTANLDLKADYVLPKDGVYASVSYLRGVPHPSFTNVGTNPTVGESKERKVETHFFDSDLECYGETVYVSFIERIRDERKFSSLLELKGQLEKDKATAMEILKGECQ